MDSMVDVLRGIKQARQNYRLHSIIVSGTHRVLEKATLPFNKVPVPAFKEQDFLQVFDEFNHARGKAFDTQIPIDILERTRGHADLTAFYCKMLDKMLMSIDRTGRVSLDEWVEYAMLKLPTELNAYYAPMQKMIDSLTANSAREARELLATRFLPANRPHTITDPDEEELSRFLAAEGALIPLSKSGPNVFEISSPLVHTLLIEKVIPNDKRSNVPDCLPFVGKDNKSLDISSLILNAMQAFDPNVIDSALGISYKHLVGGLGLGLGLRNNQRVPSDFVYHVELFAILKSWLPTYGVTVTGEVNNVRLPSCKIVIDSADHRYALELMASGNETSVKEHIDSLKEFKKIIKAKEGWLIHFTLSEIPFLPGHADLGDIKVITISHDLRWTRATVHITGKEKFSIAFGKK